MRDFAGHGNPQRPSSPAGPVPAARTLSRSRPAAKAAAPGAEPGPSFDFSRLPVQLSAEREADHAAGNVLSGKDPGSIRPLNPPAEVPALPPLVRAAVDGPGRPLDPGTRAFLEPRFGHDFRGVRVHDDARAGAAARAVGAAAFTVGRDMVFQAGRYAPGTAGGDGLLAHELTHVVQQDRGRPALQRQAADGIPAPPVTSGPGWEEERKEYDKFKRRFQEEEDKHGKRIAGHGPGAGEFLEIWRRLLRARRENKQRLAPPVESFPRELFKREGLDTNDRVGKKTASLIQSALEGSRILRPYIGDNLGKKGIPGSDFVIHEFDETFEHDYVKLNKLSAGSRDYQDRTLVRGFFHRGSDSIHLRESSNLGDAVHESIHKFSSAGFRTTFGGFMDEGVTQYFTDRLLVEQGLNKANKHRYADQLRCAQDLVAVAGEPAVAEAFFLGQPALGHYLMDRLGLDGKGLHDLRQNGGICGRIKDLRKTDAAAAAAVRKTGGD